jgi:mannose-1-phosphate guanylyltransferase
MQAVILVGGEGTRLRPLTSTVPKPVVPLVDRPFISFMLEWLHAHGIDDVIMSCGFLATSVRNVLGDGSAYGIRLRFVEEPDPRGTAGALKFAESLLDERFLMLNGDVLTDIDLTEQIAQHERTGAKATLALVPVEDPSAYGLVHLEDDHAVREFVEKPSSDRIDTNLISAGAYVLERSILELVPSGRNVSIEREVWPRLVGEGLYGFPSQSYWLDIGTPARYLQGTFDILEGNVRTAVHERLGDSYLSVAEGAQILGRAIPPAVIECRARGDPRWQRDRRELHATQLHRRRWLSDRRRHPHPRGRRAGRGSHRRSGQHDRGRCAYLPRCDAPRRRYQVLDCSSALAMLSPGAR